MSDERNTEQGDDPNVDIYLVGLGIAGVWHLTREAEACLSASRNVFTIDPGFGVREHLSEVAGGPIHDLLGEYQESGNRLDTYRRMAARVVESSLEEAPACLAVYGHPQVLVYPSTLIRRAAEALGLRVYSAPGISSFDTMMIDLDLDPVFNGLQIYEANGLIAERRRLDPEVPCLVLQPDAVESAYHSTAPSRASRFDGLREHLLQFYPADHEVTVVCSSSFAGFDAEKTTFPLGDLSQAFEEHQLAGTLYVPPAREPQLDEEFVRTVFDPLHVNRITYPREA